MFTDSVLAGVVKSVSTREFIKNCTHTVWALIGLLITFSAAILYKKYGPDLSTLESFMVFIFGVMGILTIYGEYFNQSVLSSNKLPEKKWLAAFLLCSTVLGIPLGFIFSQIADNKIHSILSSMASVGVVSFFAIPAIYLVGAEYARSPFFKIDSIFSRLHPFIYKYRMDVFQKRPGLLLGCILGVLLSKKDITLIIPSLGFWCYVLIFFQSNRLYACRAISDDNSTSGWIPYITMFYSGIYLLSLGVSLKAAFMHL